MYNAQLNSYALIAENLGLGSVSKLALIYMEPLTDCLGMDMFCSHEGLQMHFYPKIIQVKRDNALIPHLLQQASTILKRPLIPETHAGCKNCGQVERFMTFLTIRKPSEKAII